MPDRHRLLKRGIRLEFFSVAYNVIEGLVATAAGLFAGSIALVGFGLDSAIETIAAVVVLRRFRVESRGDEEDFARVERRAERVVGSTLFLLCAYVLYESASTLYLRERPESSVVGIVLAALSLSTMPLLAVAKRRTARTLGSRALAADASETTACAYLSFTLLLGLSLNAALGWWWADPIAALIMVPLILREAFEAWKGEDQDRPRK
jgi:divalent metal cation (Fe/Co/Zn/Cd) transporter